MTVKALISDRVNPDHQKGSKRFTLLRFKAAVFCSVLVLLLTGCEASLNIEKIEQELNKQVRRTDQFQGVAENQSHYVSVGADGSNALVLTRAKESQHWTRHIIDKQSTLIDVVACPDQSFIALGTDKTLWHSQNNGLEWQAIELPTQEDVMAINCAKDNSFWVVGSFSTILSSHDQGKNWNTNTLNEDAMLTGIFFIDAKTAIVVGEFGVVSRSDDAGVTWNPPEYIPNDFYVQNAHFESAQKGWVGGLSGQILYTQDGGRSWSQQLTPTESPIYGFYQSPQKLLAFGDHSTLLQLNGQQWIRAVAPKRPVYLRDAMLLGSGKLLLVGGSGSLYEQDISAMGKQVSPPTLAAKTDSEKLAEPTSEQLRN